jgi:large subunit ribosomal protein L25
MERVKLVVKHRDETGSRAVRRLRKQGVIPGVLYGSGKPATAITVEAPLLRAAVTTAAGMHAVLDVVFEGQKRGHTAIVKDLELDKVRHVVTHVDLQEIRLDETIQTTVGIQVEGTPHGVKMGGVLDIVEHEVAIEGLPTDIPEHLTLNIEELDIGDVARIKDIIVPDTIKILDDLDEAVCTVLTPRVVVEEVEEVAEEAAAEPEVVGKAEGEEPSEE